MSRRPPQIVSTVDLPSGKVLEVLQPETGAPYTRVRQPALDDTDRDLCVCEVCASELVEPVEWASAGADHWRVALRCPNCDHWTEGVFSQECVDRFDERLDDGTAVLLADMKRLEQANMSDAVDRFVGALHAGRNLARGLLGARFGQNCCVVSNYRHRLPAAIERLDAMPALAESRNRVLRILLDLDMREEDLITAIESDVALVVAVMRLANADERKRGRVATVPEAVRVLAPEGVETLARRIGVYGFFERLPGWQVPPERFRLHAVAVAGTADMIAREIDHPRPDELLVAALLHDLGKVVMADAYPDYAERMTDTTQSPDERVRAERREYGVDHAVIGGVLLRRWRMPQVIARAVELHHSPEADGEAAIVSLADGLTRYELGEVVRPAELEAAAARVGLDRAALESLMYRLPDRGGEPRRRTVAKSPLSNQEREVLKGLAASKVYKEIALDLGIAASTVRSHLHNVYSKLGAADRAQAVLIASREGWI